MNNTDTNTTNDKRLTSFRQVWQYLHSEGKCDQIDSDEFKWVLQDWEHNLRPWIGLSCFIIVSVRRFECRQLRANWLMQKRVAELQAKDLTLGEEQAALDELLEQTVTRHGLTVPGDAQRKQRIKELRALTLTEDEERAVLNDLFNRSISRTPEEQAEHEELIRSASAKRRPRRTHHGQNHASVNQ